MPARIVTGGEAVEFLFGLRPDVMVLAEARTTFPLRDGYSSWREPPAGTYFAEDEQGADLAREPWRDVDAFGVEGLDRARFASASTDTPIGRLRVLGVCIPWHMAEVTYPVGEKRRPWELHVRYLEAAGPDRRSRVSITALGNVVGTCSHGPS